MVSHQFLYVSQEDLEQQLSCLQEDKHSLIQIFTNELRPEQGMALAQAVQTICPNASVIGTSVSGVIYQGEQYDNRTLVVAEQYDNVVVETCMLAMEHQSYSAIANQINDRIGETDPALLRLFVGAYYDYAHQLLEKMNVLRPNLKIVGGMAGELQPDPTITPFVFNPQQWMAKGLVLCALKGADLMLYGRINTAHEPIGQVHTITQARDRAILAIDGEPSKEWLQRNFGVLSNKAYKTWAEIAQNDPLVRLQLSLVQHKSAIRFIRYDEAEGEITQYFSRLPTGSQFRISYTSPSKCAEESQATCLEVAETPIEQLFCYSCLFRKLYLKNCAKWELSPYHKNPVNGVFLLGEFGYTEQGNTLLNGSCVLSGVAEQERYLSVDMHALDAMEEIRNEDEKLMDFIIRKQRETSSKDHHNILEAMVANESNRICSPYQRMKLGVSVGDMCKYEEEKDRFQFNKLCMIRAENADTIISQQGQLGYFTRLKYMLEQISMSGEDKEIVKHLRFYSVKDNTFLVTANQAVSRLDFTRYTHTLQLRCDQVQKKSTEMPLLLRFVLVRNHPYLLERAYTIMESCKNSQLHVVTDDHFEDGELTPIRCNDGDELKTIRLLQYALAHDTVIPYYQGLFNNQTGKVDKYEALMRIMDANGQMYTPNYFMDISKKYRLYLDLNLKMFHEVLRDFSQVDCSVSINLSVHDILSPRFRREMRQALTTFHKPSNLTFELLEDECIDNLEGVKAFIAEVRSYGVKIAVDDFGAGYSNLLEIINVKPDFIKIDGQIISSLGQNKENESILEAVALLSERLSIELVAEYVETAAIQERILAHSVFYSQGYHFSKPQPFSQVRREIMERDGIAAIPQKMPEPESVQISGQRSDAEEEQLFLNAVQSLTSDSLFRFDLRTGESHYFGVVHDNLSLPIVVHNFPQDLIDMGLVVEEDVATLCNSVDMMRQGLEEPAYFRVMDESKTGVWHRLDYRVIKDQRHTPIEVVGKLTNIQEQKDLEARINIDTMTGCLRKDAFETLAQDYIQKHPKGKGMLFIVDLDNFKSVNDNLGHQFGDRVIRGVGDKLRALFRGDDFVGRIGGDEFMVLMTGVDDMEVGKRKASSILSALAATYTGAAHAYHVSASIGMALYPRDGSDFQTLYDHADIAMFDAKNRGKNGYVVYHNTLSKGTMENTMPYEVAARTLAQHYDSHVVEEAFNLLFETKEIEISLQMVLELIGSRFDVSRCYIFERHPFLLNRYQNTYEWCNTGVSQEKDNMDTIPASLLQELFDQANNDGVLYCNDMSMLKQQEMREMMDDQGICSFLHTYIYSGEGVSYIIGMDDCNGARVWTPIEISTILQAGKIIAQFLSYKRALTEANSRGDDRLDMLEALNCFAYIVDRHTHELIYFNQYTRKNAPQIKVGEICYQALRGATSSCGDCPLKNMVVTGDTEGLSIISNSVLADRLLTMTTFHPSFAGRDCACVAAIPLDTMTQGELRA